ncbi:hypothetical protein C8T65DRAFT_699773 [Cerioporus squamosus]|nr:hypothetical protein C8T65DRAFT_699773 [Cerioporus squamosus]
MARRRGHRSRRLSRSFRVKHDRSKREAREKILDAIFRAMKTRAIGAPDIVEAWLEQHEEHKRQLTEKGVLRPALDLACERQTYGIVVSQIIYYYNHPELIGTNPSAGETLGSLRLCDAASRVEYRGSGHHALYNALVKLQHDSTTGMARPDLVPVVVGTGVGKSRMVERMAWSVFTVRVRIGRPLIGSNGKVLSGSTDDRAPDEAVYKYLVEETAGLDSGRVLARTLVFMTGLATEIKKMLESQFERLAMSVRSYDLLVSAWSGYYRSASNRRELFLGAIKEARTLEYLSRQALVPRMKSAMSALCDTLPDPPPSGKGQSQASTALIPVKSLKLIFSFDEQSSETSSTTEAGILRHGPMSKCFAELTESPLIGILLSRSPKALTKFGGSSLKLPLQVCFPFESHREDEIDRSGDEEELNDVSNLGLMCRFGRPLFFAHWQVIEREMRVQASQGNKPRMPPAEYIISHVRTQLLGGSNHTDRFWEVRRSGTYGPLAVLDVRLALDLDAQTDIALRASERMVAENMRILYHDPKRPHALLSSYPSEPVLAEAAAQQMWHWRPEGSRSMSLLDVLVDESKSGLVSLSDDDACLVGRYILLLSHDRAIGTLPPDPTAPIPDQPWFSDEVPVPRFISSIFTRQKASQVLRCLPDNVLDGRPLEDELEDAFVHFTHFVKVQSAAITLDNLRAAYIRGAAFRIVGRKRPVHCVIPIRMKKGAGLESVFSLMAFRFNNDDDTTSPAQMRLDPKAQGYFPGYDQYTRPYIMLTWDIMAPLAEDGESSAGDSMEIDERPTEGPSGALLPPGEDAHVHPRYTIQALGISSGTYNEVHGGDQGKYRYLLTSQRGGAETGEGIFIPSFCGASGHGHLGEAQCVGGKGSGGRQLPTADDNWKPSVVV